MILDLLIALIDGLVDAWLLYGPSRRHTTVTTTRRRKARK